MNLCSNREKVMCCGGYLVAPAEIEDAILANGGITACQVVAVAQPAGVRPVAFVIADRHAEDEATLIERCKTRLAKYKVPIRIFYVDSFATIDGPNGIKVKRNELRDLAEKLLLRESA